jgi:hypothetical protein
MTDAGETGLSKCLVAKVVVSWTICRQEETPEPVDSHGHKGEGRGNELLCRKHKHLVKSV